LDRSYARAIKAEKKALEKISVRMSLGARLMKRKGPPFSRNSLKLIQDNVDKRFKRLYKMQDATDKIYENWNAARKSAQISWSKLKKMKAGK
jgi:hypothetical protein